MTLCELVNALYQELSDYNTLGVADWVIHSRSICSSVRQGDTHKAWSCQRRGMEWVLEIRIDWDLRQDQPKLLCVGEGDNVRHQLDDCLFKRFSFLKHPLFSFGCVFYIGSCTEYGYELSVISHNLEDSTKRDYPIDSGGLLNLYIWLCRDISKEWGDYWKWLVLCISRSFCRIQEDTYREPMFHW